MSDFTISSDAISSNIGNGIIIQDSSGTLENTLESFTVSDNTINSNTGNGLNISNNGLMSDLTISSDAISNNGGGIYITNNGPLMSDLTISNNTLPAGSGGNRPLHSSFFWHDRKFSYFREYHHIQLLRGHEHHG